MDRIAARSQGHATIVFLLRLQCLEIRRLLVEALEASLDRLRVVQRAQHDQHNRAERRELREPCRIGDAESADEQQERHSLVHDLYRTA